MRGYTQDKDAYLKRLRRIEGQVRGLQRMVENDTYCIDILTQVSAVTRALQAVALGLVEDHLGHCVTQAIEEGGPQASEKVKEASEAIARLARDVRRTTGADPAAAPRSSPVTPPASPAPAGARLRSAGGRRTTPCSRRPAGSSRTARGSRPPATGWPRPLAWPRVRVRAAGWCSRPPARTRPRPAPRRP